MIEGVVIEWHPELGWGVLSAPEMSAGCWFHFSHLTSAVDEDALHTGATLPFSYEEAEQDGYGYRATVVGPGRRRLPERGPSGAYTSSLRLDFDEE